MSVQRYTTLSRGPGMMAHPHGDWVSYEAYQEMADYADRLVEHSNMPCLPKDLENLREANAAFAIENEKLKELLRSIKKELTLATL